MGGAPGASPPPLQTKIFLILCSFWENLTNLYVVAPPRSWRPLLRGILYPPLLIHFSTIELDLALRVYVYLDTIMIYDKT